MEEVQAVVEAGAAVLSFVTAEANLKESEPAAGEVAGEKRSREDVAEEAPEAKKR